MFQDKVDLLKSWIMKSDNIIFFGGAGVSTESGIPDFRSTEGLYHRKYDYPPETILSHDFFIHNTEEFYRFYKDKMIHINAQPNITHVKLAELEEMGKMRGIITQNIDGLHQTAGSKKVIELHGSILRNHCMNCGKTYSLEYILGSEGTPVCSCSGTIKPEVVLYQEPLVEPVIREAIRLISEAELLIVGGTSLNVYPAAGLINYYQGDKLVLINNSVTPYDKKADLLITAGLGEVFSQI